MEGSVVQRGDPFSSWPFSQVQSLRGNLAYSTMVLLHCKKNETCPLLSWKATTHTYWFYAISHKLRHAHSKSLIFQTRVQALGMGNDCRTNEPFPSSEFFPIFVVFLMWFIQTRTRQMQGPLANESLGIIYLLWKQLWEPKMGNKAVYRNNLSLGNLLSRWSEPRSTLQLRHNASVRHVCATANIARLRRLKGHVQ